MELHCPIYRVYKYFESSVMSIRPLIPIHLICKQNHLLKIFLVLLYMHWKQTKRDRSFFKSYFCSLNISLSISSNFDSVVLWVLISFNKINKFRLYLRTFYRVLGDVSPTLYFPEVRLCPIQLQVVLNLRVDTMTLSKKQRVKKVSKRDHRNKFLYNHINAF